MSQGRYWLLTIPAQDWSVPDNLPEPIQYLKGQQEHGATGYHHWQLLVAFKSKCRLAAVKRCFTPTTHAELTKSDAANDYVWKDDTAVADTRFELGRLAFRRNNKADWDGIRTMARQGQLDSIDADVYVRWVYLYGFFNLPD